MFNAWQKFSDFSTEWVRSLPAAELQLLHRLTTPRLTRFVPHRPTVPQAAFLLIEGREALYGGAAGGGKSDALLMAALQYVDVPGYSAILFRRTYADLSLPEALMDRAHEWLAGTGAQWRDKEKTWTFPSGATLTFGYLETEVDKYRYQGAAFQFIGFDELTQFTETQYRYLFSRLRRLEGSLLPPRMRAASNPGGVGHEWVKQRFLVEGRAKGRVFVPARLEDNPHLDRADYEKSLDELDPVTRQQLRSGDWNAREGGGYFKREWLHVIDELPRFPIRWVRYWDLAATEVSSENPDPDWTVGVKLGECRGEYIVGHVRRFRKGPGGVEDEVKATADLDGNIPVYIEQEPGSAGKIGIKYFARDVLAGKDFHGEKASGDKLERAKPFSAAASNGLVSLLRGDWNSAYLDELEAFPSGGHDDQVDASSGAFSKVFRKRLKAPTFEGEKSEAQRAQL